MTELGNRLKEAREAKGLSLTDVQEITKIQKRYLAGIEEGDYKMMPGKFYIRAFIKQYAEAVGLDADELFEQYKSEIPSAYEDEIPQRATKTETTRANMSVEPSKLMENLPKILLTVFVVGALFLVWLLMPKGDHTETDQQAVKVEETEKVTQKTNEQAAPNEEEPAEEKPAPAVEETPVQPALKAVSSSGRKSTYTLSNAEKFEIGVSSTGETWVEIEDESGKKHFAGMLRKGETQSFDLTGQTAVSLVIGFAPDTVITVNGETLAYSIPAADEVRQDIVIQAEPPANE